MMSRRQDNLDEVVARLQQRYGLQAIRREPVSERATAPHISTTFTELDVALGTGGLPRGRISEITGPATSGKVTLAAKVLVAAQRESTAMVAWLDLSQTCDPDYLQRCGLDLDRLLIVHPETGDDALAITLYLVESNTLAALVFDGLADLDPGSESLLAGTLERLAVIVTRTETAVLFLAELQAQYRTLAHLATVRLELHRERWIMQGCDVRGYEGQVNVLKHKLGREGAAVPIRITFDDTVRGDGLL